MKSLFSLFSLTALALACYAFTVPNAGLQKRSACDGGSLIETSSITVGDRIVQLSTLACPSSLFPRGHITKKQNVSDACDALCTTTCNTLAGDLPPETDDCDTIVDAITILNGSIAPTFVVDPGYEQQLTYGTCRFFFQNLGSEPLEYCWLALSDVASAAESTCFPPTQPVYSEGLCQAPSGDWAVGAAHS